MASARLEQCHTELRQLLLEDRGKSDSTHFEAREREWRREAVGHTPCTPRGACVATSVIKCVKRVLGKYRALVHWPIRVVDAVAIVNAHLRISTDQLGQQQKPASRSKFVVRCEEKNIEEAVY